MAELSRERIDNAARALMREGGYAAATEPRMQRYAEAVLRADDSLLVQQNVELRDALAALTHWVDDDCAALTAARAVLAKWEDA